MTTKVKALNLLTNEKVEFVGENKEIANIILNKLCKFVEINNNVAYYNSEYAFDISEYINEAILVVAKRQRQIEIE